MRTLVAGALALTLSIGTAQAASLGNLFTGYFSIGDSLVDPGNLFAATGGTTPAAPYVNGRFSNGPVLSEFLAQHFDTSSNFAHGGARVIDPMAGPLPLHLDAQLQLLQGQALQGNVAGSLVTLVIGSNDLLGALNTVAATQPADPTSLIVDTAVSAATALSNAISTIAGYGPAGILVTSAPDLGVTSRFISTPLAPLATLASTTFNSVLATVPGLSTSETTVTLFDSVDFFSAINADPTRVGLDPSLLLTPCFTPGLNAAPDCEGFLFVDGIHPTTTVHAVLASQIEAALLGELLLSEVIAPSPVPLPAGLPLLALGLGGLVLIRPRKRSA